MFRSRLTPSKVDRYRGSIVFERAPSERHRLLCNCPLASRGPVYHTTVLFLSVRPSSSGRVWPSWLKCAGLRQRPAARGRIELLRCRSGELTSELGTFNLGRRPQACSQRHGVRRASATDRFTHQIHSPGFLNAEELLTEIAFLQAASRPANQSDGTNDRHMHFRKQRLADSRNFKWRRRSRTTCLVQGR